MIIDPAIEWTYGCKGMITTPPVGGGGRVGGGGGRVGGGVEAAFECALLTRQVQMMVAHMCVPFAGAGYINSRKQLLGQASPILAVGKIK